MRDFGPPPYTGPWKSALECIKSLLMLNGDIMKFYISRGFINELSSFQEVCPDNGPVFWRTTKTIGRYQISFPGFPGYGREFSYHIEDIDYNILRSFKAWNEQIDYFQGLVPQGYPPIPKFRVVSYEKVVAIIPKEPFYNNLISTFNANNCLEILDCGMEYEVWDTFLLYIAKKALALKDFDFYSHPPFIRFDQNTPKKVTQK